MRTGERGFTYLWLLFLLAAGGAALAAAGQRWSAIMQSERERELIFRGEQIAEAIAAYRGAQGAGAARWPASWDELLEDRRGPALRRHLRRAYADPFTGEADWEPILDEEGRWRGVRSRSTAPARLVRATTDMGLTGKPLRVSDHRFVADDPAADTRAVIPANADGSAGENGD